MDIFVSNLPEQMTEKQVRLYFKPLLARFEVHTFHCEKSKGKRFATITILSAVNATNFLTAHGQSESGPRGFKLVRQKLFHMNVGVYCRPGRTPPGQYSLASLEKQEKERLATAKTKKVAKTSVTEAFYRVYDIVELHCGQWDYDAEDLVFCSYYQFNKMGRITFTDRKLHISFPEISIPGEKAGHCLEIPYYSVDSFVTGDIIDPSLTLSLRLAPKIYYRSTSQDQNQSTDSKQPADLINQLLGLSVSNSKPSKPKDQRFRLSSIEKFHEPVASSCLCYRLRLRQAQDVRKIYQLRKRSEIPPSVSLRTSIVWRRPFAAQLTRLSGTLAGERYFRLPFELKFQIQKLAQNGYLSPDSVTNLLQALEPEITKENSSAFIDAIRYLQARLPFRGPDAEAFHFDLDNMVLTIREIVAGSHVTSQYQAPVAIHEHMMLVHKATVTPAGTYLEGPTSEIKNRVLRKYEAFPTFFLSVSFLDEDYEKVHHDPKTSNEKIYEDRFKTILEGNITIAGRPFEFLGFSHSSLRAHTAWFMSPFSMDNVLMHARLVINHLGDFSHIRSPAKCAARIGQAFSQALNSIQIPLEAVERIPDVERNGRTFSDGVGTCSQDILHLIWEYSSRSRSLKPTILQIRFQGAKGVISLDSRLEGAVLRLRPSMVKFEGSNATDIEICGSANKPLPLLLNRQTIKILEDLGVPHDTFLKLQTKAIEALRKATLSIEDASSFLEDNRIGGAARLPWLFRRLQGLKLSFRSDDLLRKVLEISVLSRLREIKYKARIPVEEGWNLYGIMDETNTLEVGEVYCSIADDTGVRVITGEVVVTRCPALHPGDIQCVRAVNVPEGCALRNLYNFVAFSSKGERDLPSCLSGGDLDGDLYNIIYDPDLYPESQYSPAEYEAPKAIDIGRAVERTDITKHFLNFMMNDTLGQIATLHQILADREDLGTLDEQCLELAQLHSDAVDFSKTGIPVNQQQIQRYPRERPDFLAPGPRVLGHSNIRFEDRQIRPIDEDVEEINDAESFEPQTIRYYESRKILGKLYRDIDEQSFLAELQSHAVEWSLCPNHEVIGEVWNYVRTNCVLIQWEHLQSTATEIKECYEDNLVDCMLTYTTRDSSYVSEVEVFSGILLGRFGALSKRQKEYSSAMKEKHERDVAYTVSCIRSGIEGNGEEEALARSMACLFVGLTKDRTHKRVGALVSFGWVAAAVCLSEVDKMLAAKVPHQAFDNA